jgi:hypothetical protein
MEPLDLVVDPTLDPGQGPVRLNEHVTAYLRPRTVVPRYHTLSPTQTLVRDTINRYGMATSSQLRRLHYEGTERGTRVRSSDHLLKMSRRGFIRRIPFTLNGEYVYAPIDSKSRIPNLHTLDITELMVQLVTTFKGVKFDPEPWAHTRWRGQTVTPDAYVLLNGSQYWVEIDRASESPSVISAKMNRFVGAFKASYVPAGETPVEFPQIIWLAHESDRVRTLSREAEKKHPGLFECALFRDAIGVMSSPR